MDIKSLKSGLSQTSPSAPAVRLGKIEKRWFNRRNTKVPSNFTRVKRFNYHTFFNQLRLVFFTDTGIFYGPPFIKQSGEPGDSSRQLICPVLTDIEFDFTINNVLCFDFEYSQIVKPDATFPLEIYASESIQFAFYFPFYIFPDGRVYCV